MKIRELIEAEIVEPLTDEDREIIVYYWLKFMESYDLYNWNHYQFFADTKMMEMEDDEYDNEEALNNECREHLTYTIVDTINNASGEIDTIEQIYDDIAYVFNDWYTKDYSVVEDFKEFVFSEIDKDVEFENTAMKYNA
jgi:hypothetical protein